MHVGRRMALIAASVAVMSASQPGLSYAQSDQFIEQVTGRQMQRLVQSWGYRADLTDDSERDPLIRTAMSGANVSIVFYNCTKEGVRSCEAVQFSAGFNMRGKVPPYKINEWNQKQRYLKAFLDKDNDPFVQYDIALAGGVSAENLKLALKRYETNLGLFMSHVEFKKIVVIAVQHLNPGTRLRLTDGDIAEVRENPRDGTWLIVHGWRRPLARRTSC